MKSIIQWLEKTNFKICVVENSGYVFPELDEYKEKYVDRFEILAYNEAKIPELQHIALNDSKGSSELYAINYAHENTKFRDVNFFIKITCRYFVPDLEQLLIDRNVLQNTKSVGLSDGKEMIIAIRQSNNERCEIVGSHSCFFKVIFNPCLTNESGEFFGHVETVYCNRMKLLNQANILICPKLTIEPTPMGGVDVVNTVL
jgi:hypothetical protein